MKNKAVTTWPPSPRPVQPHQGRNPCMERNTMPVGTTIELSVLGNALIDRSLKHRPCLQAPPSNQPSSAMALEAPPTASRIVNPIPYVQNAVRGESAQGGSGSRHSLATFFRLNSKNQQQSAGRQLAVPEDQQGLCSPSSDLEADVSPSAALPKANNQDVAALVKSSTQVQWQDPDRPPTVSVVKWNNQLTSAESQAPSSLSYIQASMMPPGGRCNTNPSTPCAKLASPSDADDTTTDNP